MPSASVALNFERLSEALESGYELKGDALHLYAYYAFRRFPQLPPPMRSKVIKILRNAGITDEAGATLFWLAAILYEETFDQLSVLDRVIQTAKKWRKLVNFESSIVQAACIDVIERFLASNDDAFLKMDRVIAVRDLIAAFSVCPQWTLTLADECRLEDTILCAFNLVEHQLQNALKAVYGVADCAAILMQIIEQLVSEMKYLFWSCLARMFSYPDMPNRRKEILESLLDFGLFRTVKLHLDELKSSNQLFRSRTLDLLCILFAICTQSTQNQRSFDVKTDLLPVLLQSIQKIHNFVQVSDIPKIAPGIFMIWMALLVKDVFPNVKSFEEYFQMQNLDKFWAYVDQFPMEKGTFKLNYRMPKESALTCLELFLSKYGTLSTKTIGNLVKAAEYYQNQFQRDLDVESDSSVLSSDSASSSESSDSSNESTNTENMASGCTQGFGPKLYQRVVQKIRLLNCRNTQRTNSPL